MKMNTIGISRSLLVKFNEMKKSKISTDVRSENSGVIQTDNGKTSLLGERRMSFGLEMKNVNTLKFMDVFDKTNRLFKEIQLDFGKLQIEQNRRILPKFDEIENMTITNSIHRLVKSITKKIVECEENIKAISQLNGLNLVEQKMKDNIKINLACKLQEITRKIRNNEEDFMLKFKELGHEETTRESSPDYKPSKANDFLELSLNDEKVLRQRDLEINSLVKSITELSVVFKEISILVNEQGTILDRIDYNIESTIENTKQAIKHLLKTEKTIESGCARNSIMILLIIIFVEVLMLLLKFK